MFVQQWSRRLNRVSRKTAIVAASSVLLVTGTIAGVTASTASAAQACEKTQTPVTDPNLRPLVTYAKVRCDLAEEADVYTVPGFRNAATGATEDMAQIGTMSAPSRPWFACQRQFESNADGRRTLWRSGQYGSNNEQSTWWVLTQVNENADSPADQQQRREQLDGWGWVSAATLADYVPATAGAADRQVPVIPVCGTPQARYNQSTSQPAARPAASPVASRPQATPRQGSTTTVAPRPAGAYNPNAPLRSNTASERCAPAGQRNTPVGGSLPAFTCDVIAQANKPQGRADVYSANRNEPNKVVGYMNPGKNWFVCWATGPTNPKTTNSDGTVNANNRWLLTISDGPRQVWGGVPATAVAQGGDNQPVEGLPECPNRRLV